METGIVYAEDPRGLPSTDPSDAHCRMNCVQGLHWYAASMVTDADGDTAHEFRTADDSPPDQSNKQVSCFLMYGRMTGHVMPTVDGVHTRSTMSLLDVMSAG